jgi:SAM-dependent methyltransferase
MHTAHGTERPSDWVQRWATVLSPGSRVLDVAGGMGRHSRYLAALGHRVTLVDVSSPAVANASQINPSVQAVQADLENAAWPFAPAQFDAVVVTNYLWRSLFPPLLTSLAPEGVLIYETFARGQEAIGRPSRPEFLLERAELLRHCQGMHVLAYEDLRLSNPDRFVQRICARVLPR